jgi:hypothetical protein
VTATRSEVGQQPRRAPPRRHRQRRQHCKPQRQYMRCSNTRSASYHARLGSSARARSQPERGGTPPPVRSHQASATAASRMGPALPGRPTSGERPIVVEGLSDGPGTRRNSARSRRAASEIVARPDADVAVLPGRPTCGARAARAKWRRDRVQRPAPWHFAPGVEANTRGGSAGREPTR